MSMLMTLKKGNRLPVATFAVSLPGGAALGFVTGDVVSVKLVAKADAAAVLKIDAAATGWEIDGAGKVLSGTYAWAAGDVDTFGEWLVDVVVTVTGGKTISFPNDSWGILRII